jgi:hypothetical protein
MHGYLTPKQAHPPDTFMQKVNLYLWPRVSIYMETRNYLVTTNIGAAHIISDGIGTRLTRAAFQFVS